jgi:ferric-dicitrate binding protein FerR (iron transport regulator)
MVKKTIHKDYSGHSFEEFMQDDFFISSMNHPTPETSAFWERFMQENEDNRTCFDDARTYLETLKEYYTTLSQDDIDKMKENILSQKNGKSKSKNRNLLYWGTSVAASIALLIIFTLPYMKTEGTSADTTDIRSFAERQIVPKNLTKETQLVLSNEKILAINRTEAEITYDTAGICIHNFSRIAKTETASFNQLIVPAAKRSVVNLSDGSKIHVNADSRLVYPVVFDGGIREIYVEGEIFIDVAPEEKRPFIVRTKNTDVRVTGTKFNVTAYEMDNEEKIVLVSGAVQITSKENFEETLLLPNQMYWSENGHSRVEQVNVKNYTSWVNDCYYCENERLSSILKRLSRYYGVEIACEQTIAQVIFSGKLDLKEHISDIFDGIAFTLPITYAEENGKYVVRSVRK